jgi:hypothetical protein
MGRLDQRADHPSTDYKPKSCESDGRWFYSVLAIGPSQGRGLAGIVQQYQDLAKRMQEALQSSSPVHGERAKDQNRERWQFESSESFRGTLRPGGIDLTFGFCRTRLMGGQ